MHKVVALSAVLLLIPLYCMGTDVVAKFHIQDESGNPVTNAVVAIDTRRDKIEKSAHGRIAMREIRARTDGEGHAHINFPCFSGEFRYSVSAPGFYSWRSPDVLFKRREGGVFGLVLTEHEKNIEVLLRKVRNPIPMCGCKGRFKIPSAEGRFGFDLEKCDWVRPYGVGVHADFWIRYEEKGCDERNYQSRGVMEFEGRYDGAYKTRTIPGSSFQTVYEADVQATYLQTLDLYSWCRTGSEFQEKAMVGDADCLVLRTRSVVDKDGRLVSCNYSRICGRIYTMERAFHLGGTAFNPLPNDPNLEFDETRNLVPRRRR